MLDTDQGIRGPGSPNLSRCPLDSSTRLVLGFPCGIAPKLGTTEQLTMNPEEKMDPLAVPARSAGRERRVAETRERLEEVVDRLRSEGCSEGEISAILSNQVAAVMERTGRSAGTPPQRPMIVDLSHVPPRFSVSAVMALYHLQSKDRHPAQLGEIVGVSPAAMTGILDTLEGRGLVSRVRDPEDRRRVHVALTEAGRKLVACFFLN